MLKIKNSKERREEKKKENLSNRRNTCIWIFIENNKNLMKNTNKFEILYFSIYNHPSNLIKKPF